MKRQQTENTQTIPYSLAGKTTDAPFEVKIVNMDKFCVHSCGLRTFYHFFQQPCRIPLFARTAVDNDHFHGLFFSILFYGNAT